MKTSFNTLTRACLMALGLSLCPLVHAEAAAAAGIIGQLTNAEHNRVYAGARITLVELNLSTESQRDGSFRFTNVPAGSYTLHVSYLGAAPVTQKIAIDSTGIVRPTVMLNPVATAMADIVVRGQRSGQASAINQQRVSDRISSIVSADAIGQFPDQNAAESLQRLPGLSIERDQGEGRFVGIRGIDPNLNNVTINGLNIPSPEAGVRSVALDVIPSELIQSLEVAKSITPDMDADAIGGAVTVKSVSAFDRQQKTTASATVQGGYNTLREAYNPKLAGSLTHQFSQTLGIAAALSYFDRDFGSDNIESNGADEVEQRHYTITRERLGAAINIDWRPDFNNQYYLRTLYSKFSDDEYRQAVIYTLEGEDSQIERQSKDRYESQSIATIAAGAEHQLQQWLVSYQIGYASATEDEPDALYYVFNSENSSVDGELDHPIPIVSFDADATDISQYETDEISFEDNYAKDTDTSFKFDLSRDITLGNYPGQIKLGGKYRSREKRRDSQMFIYDGGFDALSPPDLATTEPDYGLGNFGPGLNRERMRDFFNQNRADLSLAALDSALESNGATYVNKEDISAAYFMLTADIEKLHLVAGLRYEDTDFSTAGNRVELVDDEQNDVQEVINSPWTAERRYDHLLPSINARYDVNEQLLLRAAYTQTISRPRFEDVAAFQIIESKTAQDEGVVVTEREAEVGNPDLQPYEADNLDLSIEYYPGDIGVMSAGLFYKKIDNFVVYADVAATAQWAGFEEVTQAINGETASLRGLELAWVKAFDNGFLISANTTFTDSDATTFVDGEQYDTRLPNQSDRIGNLTLGYENTALSVRLTASYKSDNLEEIDGDMLRIEDDHTQLDFMGKYFVTPATLVYFNIINITDEPFYHYFDQPNVNAQYEEYGRTFQLGLTWQL